jgi:hypothetical protein
MKTLSLYTLVILTGLLLITGGCQKEYQLGDLITPTNVNLSFEVAGADDLNPYGDGSGIVNFTATADNEITFTYEFGDGKDSKVAPDGKVSHLFSKNGTHTYNVTVFAVGTGGITSSKTVQVEVYSSFSDDEALEFLTGGTSKTWYWAYNVAGFAGLGPTTEDNGNKEYTYAAWWSIGANDPAKACMYDAEFVFTKTGNSLTFEQTTGPAFVPGTYAGKIGVEGDVCHGADVATSLYGIKNVSFSPSTSKAAIDGEYRGTTMTFSDGGFMCWWVGTSEYDIIEVTDNILKVRIKEDDTYSWYHIFTSEKPE